MSVLAWAMAVKGLDVVLGPEPADVGRAHIAN